MKDYAGFDTDFSLTGKVAIVTGAAAGIGLAIAELFLKKGASIALLDRTDNVRDIAAGMKDSLGLVCDVTDKASVEKAVSRAVERFGQVDIVVNSAGIVALDAAEELSEQDWDNTMAVNLKGVFLVSQSAGGYMLVRGQGKIINLASQAGVVALPNHVAYCASKAAVIGMTKVLALEWSPRGIQVNAISPTVVLTELGKKAWSGAVAEEMKMKIPARRFAYPPEIAACALFLASDAADMITGANLVIDGGYTIQ
ncbi:SDR family oxidoreductase [Acerihabitans arboris]|uniref:D-threitol dehydrogenase n=1 Tax=Acerihabitans arboris TaxID=2691583 RepID=A0A845SFQ4_9GAMM|nr:D-threitol dehydrogenase [Acerihabitans arboris]NDL62177.1 D-threitol dehydrogenase [Acerihabitans arboris]